MSNGHAVNDIELIPPSLYASSYRQKDDKISACDLHLVTSNNRIFTAIFPKISLLNHSCDPNIRNSFDGSFLTIYATRDINENEEILNCYISNYKLMGKTERQIPLKQQYCFDCQCSKCSSDDNTFDRYYEYICLNESCRMPIKILNSMDQRWWNELDDETYFQRKIASQFVCRSCKNQLPLDRDTLASFFNCAFDLSPSSQENQSTELLISCYMNVSKCLSKYHELKCKMAQAIFSRRIDRMYL